MRPPLEGRLTITQLFGGNPANESYTTPDGFRVIGHNGLDISAIEGQPVYPAYNSIIEIVDTRPFGYGLHAIIHVGDGRRVLYGHLSKILVPNGASVAVHSVIAQAGSTGNSTGPHVHFELHPNNEQKANGYYGAIDPISSFDLDVIQNLNLALTNL